MLVVLSRVRFFVAQAMTGLWRSAGVSTLSVMTIALALGLLAAFAVTVANLSRLADRLGRDAAISVYLADSVTDDSGDAMARELAGWPGVREANFVTSSAAMAWLRTTLGEDGAALEGLPEDVLPSSVEIVLDPRPWTTSQVKTLADRLAGQEGVAEVRWGREDIQRINALLGFARGATFFVALALGLATILIVSNTIRLTVYARRDEIEILSLIGATSLFVRTPFVIEGAIQGFVGGTLAAVAVVATRQALADALHRGLGSVFGSIELQVAPLEIFVLLVVIGTALGLFGSALAVGRFVRL